MPGTLDRAARVTREAEAVRVEAERLPERAAEIDHRLVSLRTRAEALTTRSGQVEPVLSELRRRFTAACWQDLQGVPEMAGRNVRQAEERLAEARAARDEQRWADATALLSTARALLNTTDEAVSAAGDRLRRLNAVQKNPEQEIERTRFAIRDAQRLAMAGRNTPTRATPVRWTTPWPGWSGPSPGWRAATPTTGTSSPRRRRYGRPWAAWSPGSGRSAGPAPTDRSAPAGPVNLCPCLATSTAAAPAATRSN